MKRLLITLLVCLAIVYLYLQYFDELYYSTGTRALFLLVLTILYNIEVKSKRLFFSLFLITFTIGEAVYFFTWHMEDESWNTFYYVTNFLFVLAYIFLIIRIVRNMKFLEVVKKYPVQVIILLMMVTFSVVIISGTAEYHLGIWESFLELIYNAVVMLLLSLALLNYVSEENNKAMNLLLASIFIVFSEILQYAYFYVAEATTINMIASVFTILGFTFFYLEARLSPESESEYLSDSQLRELNSKI